MQVITADTEVFEMLEKAGHAGFDPQKPLVLDFVFEKNWHLLLFNPEGERKGCRLFRIPENLLFAEAEKLLLPELLSIDHNHGYEILVDKALVIVEDLLRTKKGAGLFFDAH
mgnify:CR=1 FL=1